MGGLCGKSIVSGKILLIGLEGAGKTQLLQALCNNKLPILENSTGYIVKNVEYQGNSPDVVLRNYAVYDVGGAPESRLKWSKFYNGTVGIIFVVDSQDKTKLLTNAEVLMQVLNAEELETIPLLICSNKCDLLMSLRTHELAENLNLHKIRDRKWNIVQTSGKTNPRGVKDAFNWLIEQIHFVEKNTTRSQRRQNRKKQNERDTNNENEDDDDEIQ